MSSATKIRANLDKTRTSDHKEVSENYSNLGEACTRPSSIIIISSTFNRPVWISTDGINDMLLVDEGTIVINISANKQGLGKFSIPSGTQFQVKNGPDGSPSKGNISLTCIYGN